MKKFYLSVAVLTLAAAWFLFGFGASAQKRERKAEAPLVSPNLVISQFQASGGVADDEFVEIHNNGAAAVDLNGYRVVYRSATGTNDVGPFVTWGAPTVLKPGQDYLIVSANYDGGLQPDNIYNP